jgi:hypothetical protein
LYISIIHYILNSVDVLVPFLKSSDWHNANFFCSCQLIPSIDYSDILNVFAALVHLMKNVHKLLKDLTCDLTVILEQIIWLEDQSLILDEFIWIPLLNDTTGVLFILHPPLDYAHILYWITNVCNVWVSSVSLNCDVRTLKWRKLSFMNKNYKYIK